MREVKYRMQINAVPELQPYFQAIWDALIAHWVHIVPTQGALATCVLREDTARHIEIFVRIARDRVHLVIIVRREARVQHNYRVH